MPVRQRSTSREPIRQKSVALLQGSSSPHPYWQIIADVKICKHMGGTITKLLHEELFFLR